MRAGFPFGKKFLLKHPLAVFGVVALCVGAFLSVLGAIFFFTIPDEGGFIALLATSLQGVVWLIIGLVFYLIGYSRRRKLNFLKQEGRRFEAEVTNLYPVVGINIGTTPTVYAECVYTNDNGQRCKVKTPMFLWKSFHPEDLNAEVYVDWNDPHRYAVQLSRKPQTDTQVDIDYT